MIVELPLTNTPVRAIDALKSISSKILFSQMPNLRLRYPKSNLWSRGKFAISVGNITLEKAKEYVRTQETHHAKHILEESSLRRREELPRRARVYPEEDVKYRLIFSSI
jgi:hypothetical protein